jgi:PilZ domain
MEKRAVPRKPVFISGAVQFAGRAIACLVRDMSVSGAALDVSESDEIPGRFDLVFKADGTHIPCHVIWREEDRIGVAFD